MDKKKIGRDPMMSIRLPREKQIKVTRLANEYGMNRSRFIRTLLEHAPILWPLITQPEQVQQVSK